MNRGKKKGRIDSTLPKYTFNEPDWEDVSHEESRKTSHYRFRNRKTNEIVKNKVIRQSFI
jgi:hypothetical protein